MKEKWNRKKKEIIFLSKKLITTQCIWTASLEEQKQITV